MGKVRFYSEDGQTYVSLRVETSGVYLEDNRLSIRKRKQLPPKTTVTSAVVGNSSEDMIRLSKDVDLLAQIAAVLVDFEKTLEQDDKAMVVLKRRYKKPGLTLSVKYKNDWTDYDGGNALDALLIYKETVLD